LEEYSEFKDFLDDLAKFAGRYKEPEEGSTVAKEVT
jgi:hypothetical protein